MIDEKTELSTITIDDLLNEKKLILYNDDINSFQLVVTALCLVLGFDEIQAEQLSLIANNKGKAVIKTGDYNKLKNYYNKNFSIQFTMLLMVSRYLILKLGL